MYPTSLINTTKHTIGAVTEITKAAYNTAAGVTTAGMSIVHLANELSNHKAYKQWNDDVIIAGTTDTMIHSEVKYLENSTQKILQDVILAGGKVMNGFTIIPEENDAIAEDFTIIHSENDSLANSIMGGASLLNPEYLD